MADRIVHILRYGTVAEKKYLLKANKAYDYLSINGNSAAFVSSAIAKLITENFLTSPEKGYFIDPITYAFQRELNLLKSKKKDGTVEIKKSIKQLIDHYGAPVKSVLNDTPIKPDDLNDQDVFSSFCERVLDFQYTLVTRHIKENDLEKYIVYATDDDPTIEERLKPKFLIAPYFFLSYEDGYYASWLDINIRMVSEAKNISAKRYNNCRVFCQLVISKELLRNPYQIDSIAAKYAGLDCDGITIWVDDFSEFNASNEEIEGFIRLLKGLKGKPVYNMYGGYFSILLTHKDICLLTGVSHGLEYGESRKVYPVGGGVPVSKYYFYPLHQRLDFKDAYGLMANTGVIDSNASDWGNSNEYFRSICGCDHCKNIISNTMIDFIKFESIGFYEVNRKNTTIRRKKATGDTKENCLYHFLLCKKQEFSTVARRSISYLLAELDKKMELYKACGYDSTLDLSYMVKWSTQIGGVIDGKRK